MMYSEVSGFDEGVAPQQIQRTQKGNLGSDKWMYREPDAGEDDEEVWDNRKQNGKMQMAISWTFMFFG